MLREIVATAAFLFALSGIIAGISIVQKTVSRQTAAAERIIESANEID